MSNRFFFITTYDNISGKILSPIINTHPDIECQTSYPDVFLSTNLPSQIESPDLPLDKFMSVNTSIDKSFSGNMQQFTGLELQHKKLTQRTAQPYNTANILMSPKLRVNFILHSWMASTHDVNFALSFIEKREKLLRVQSHDLFKLYKFHYFYDLIRDYVRDEKVANLFSPQNKLFVFALAKVIAYDSADIPAPGEKFCFETLLESTDEVVRLINHVTNNKAVINASIRDALTATIQEQFDTVNQLNFPEWEEWQTQLLDKFINARLETVYHPHLDKTLAAQYTEAGYTTLQIAENNECLYSKLISIQLNSNRPAQLVAYFDNIEETTDNPTEVEVLVNIDIGDSAMKTMLEREILARKFTIKYVETERPKSFCDLWKPINTLLTITDPNSYFLVNISDEMLFVTKGWDTILRKYVGFFPDHMFRLRASRNKFRNYFDRWECSFAQDAIPITTKKWVDVGGDWNPCFGPDSFQQLISFYLAKEGKFSNSHYLREAPMTEIKFSGDVPALGIDADKAWRHHKDHIKAMQICQSYPMQLEARRRSILMKAHIIASAAHLKNFDVIDNKQKKLISLFDKDKNTTIQTFDYKVNWLSISLANQWRKLDFFSYFGDGPAHKMTLRNLYRYLRAKHFWILKSNRTILMIMNFKPKKLLKIWKIVKLKNVIFPKKISPIALPDNTAITANENVKNSLIENSLKPIEQQLPNAVVSNLPRITIIVGVLNMKRYLPATFDSVIRQNYPNLELIVMDGGSTDGTLDVIKEYEAHITFWKSGKDKGHSDACNKAINIATGDFIILLNADDILGDNLLNKAAAIYGQKPDTKVITCGVRIVEMNATGKEIVLQEITDPAKLQITLKNMLFELPVINARFFHKDIFESFGKFQATHEDGSYNLSNDRDFLVRLALAGIQSEIIPEPLYLYLSHNQSLTFSNKNAIKSRKEHLQLADKFLQKEALTIEQVKLLKAWFGNESVYLSLIYLSQFSIKNSLLTMKFGVYHCGFAWLWDFYVVALKGISKRTKKLFATKNIRPGSEVKVND